ncbi:MAG: transposase [Candidatus Roizmanbacteria bacterium]|nr:MAG: transposase [Candidatus Roizmanbacteria bacterium]
MPQRLEPFLNNSIYHVFNRTIDHRVIFKIRDSNTNIFMQLLAYYRSLKAAISFSKLKITDKKIVENLMNEVSFKKYFKVEIMAFCLMPTHFHFLLRQKTDEGIPRFISDVLNSFTRYYNIKNKRRGPIFLPKFKSVRILNDEQLKHVSRYIHLNPYSSSVIENIKDLENYHLSSFKEYLSNNKKRLSNDEFILDLFQKDKDRYERFVLMNADYQKTLEFIKHAKKW